MAARKVGAVAVGEDDLAAAVARVSEGYTRSRERIAEVAHDPQGLAARLRFFLPRDLPKVSGPLSELAAVPGALPPGRRWRVLDLGAGLGTTTLGVAGFAARTGLADALDVVAVDRDERALEIFAALAERSEEAGLVPTRAHVRLQDLRALEVGELGGPFDLVVAGLALNELGLGQDPSREPAHAELLCRWSEALAPHGSLVVLEPALRTTSRALHRVRDRIVERGSPGLFAPCLRGGECPMLARERDWCHEELDVALPEELIPVARAAGLRWEGATYAYLTLRRDGKTLRERASGCAGEPYRIVGGPRPTKGKLEAFGCGRPGRPVLMRLDRHEAAPNEALGRVGRGDLVVVDPGEPQGDRLRIRAESRVARLPHPAREPEPERD